MATMIPYDELERALARWKARAQGGGSGPIDAVEATPMPVPAEELGSIPNIANVPERTGEIDLGDVESVVETYEEN